MSGAAASPAQAAANPNPIDWHVYSTHSGPDGEDVPLGVGQKDAQGFRQYDHAQPSEPHIRQPHASAMKVVFTERVDSRSKDHRPVGIITAYYYNCGCGKTYGEDSRS
jgi:hypothetical protein